jgi:hypothetical protein
MILKNKHVRVVFSAPHDEPNRSARVDTTLLVWAGDKAHVAPDFIAVIDFDEHSPSYGKVLRTVPLTGLGAVGNESIMWVFRPMARR